MEVIIISREIIKPSYETPPHLKRLKLSYLDQLVHRMYVPFVLFYQAHESRGLTCSNHVQISQHLKQSLSKSLTSFYPLAGRIQDNFIVDCNDFGVEFIEARVHAHLMDIIQSEPNMEELKQYLPLDPTANIDNLCEKPLLVVQITFFDCGGIAVGVCFSHKIADFASMMAFINAWAATCRGEAEFSRFSFDLADYFPPRAIPGSDPLEILSNEKFITKRFLFDKEKLAALKHGSSLKNPTQVELVSAFIWECFIKVAKLNNTEAKRMIYAACHAVNLRTRTSPSQLLENVFGNGVMLALAFFESVQEYYELVSKLRSSIRTISSDYITKAQSGDNYVSDIFNMVSSLMKGESECCTFSSWSRFPVYEVDYGWGNPIWFCTIALPLKNAVVLVNSRSGEGIEAWVNMKQDYLEMLETQIKLI